MVMSYQEARDYEEALRAEFDDKVIEADVTGGLPEDPDSFDIEEAREQAEDEEEYEGPAPVGDPWIEVEPDRIHDVVEFLKNEPGYEFNSLHCLGGDHLIAEQQIAVIYHLYSLEQEQWIVLKAFLPHDEPVIDSITDLYNAADWHEREAYDMLGIRFDGHPDLRRILLPEDWHGHPLRKDYQFPESYRGIPVDWDEARLNRTTRDSFYDEAMELKEMDIDEELGFPDPNQSSEMNGGPPDGR
jgi:NADH-quinone oxidoreductase subunit C